MGPAVEAVVDRRRGTILGRAVLPAAADLEHMQDAGVHPTVIDPAGARLVLGQMRFDRRPLLVAQPEQRAHDRLRRSSKRRNHDLPSRLKPLIRFRA